MGSLIFGDSSDIVYWEANPTRRGTFDTFEHLCSDVIALCLDCRSSQCLTSKYLLENDLSEALVAYPRPSSARTCGYYCLVKAFRQEPDDSVQSDFFGGTNARRHCP